MTLNRRRLGAAPYFHTSFKLAAVSDVLEPLKRVFYFMIWEPSELDLARTDPGMMLGVVMVCVGWCSWGI